jgi:hypothetical protein
VRTSPRHVNDSKQTETAGRQLHQFPMPKTGRSRWQDQVTGLSGGMRAAHMLAQIQKLATTVSHRFFQSRACFRPKTAAPGPAAVTGARRAVGLRFCGLALPEPHLGASAGQSATSARLIPRIGNDALCLEHHRPVHHLAVYLNGAAARGIPSLQHALRPS